MRQKLNCVLLIDDERADNFYHKLIIEEEGIAHKVVEMQRAIDALAFLSSTEKETYPKPEMIFLDINMPRMTGWEFIEAYEKLNIPPKDQAIIVMLSTTFNPEDMKKAANHPAISEFRTKPLTDLILRELLVKYFSDSLTLH